MQHTIYQVVFQLSSFEPQHLKNAISQIRNAQIALPGLKVEWVLHGEAVKFLLADVLLNSEDTKSLYPAISGASKFMKPGDLVDHAYPAGLENVRILACKNALNSQNISAERILPNVTIIASAVAHIIARQAAGWSYIKVG